MTKTKKKQNLGNRSERRGHWPPGKPRNKPAKALINRIAALLDESPLRGVISLGAIAQHVGVDKKTVQRWIAGAHNPEEQHHATLADWLAKAREHLAAERRRQVRSK